MTSDDGEKIYQAQAEIGSRDKGVSYYHETCQHMSREAVELLVEYSHVRSDEIETHVLSTRDKAWEIFPYPCIGQFKFLVLSLCGLPIYPDIVQRLGNGQRYLDVGCCMGQDIRKLVMDGAPSSNLHGIDIHADFISLSYHLFQDRDTLSSHLSQGDILNIDDADTVLPQLCGTIDILHLGMMMHVFNREDQRLMLSNCIKLLNPNRGSIIVGTAVGDTKGTGGPKGNFMHSAETLQQLCSDVALELGSGLACEASLDFEIQVPNVAPSSPSNRIRRLVYVIALNGDH